MQLLYWSTVLAQSFCGSAAVLKSMHSSRWAFSSLQTQHGLGAAAGSVAGLKLLSKLTAVAGILTKGVGLGC